MPRHVETSYFRLFLAETGDGAGAAGAKAGSANVDGAGAAQSDAEGSGTAAGVDAVLVGLAKGIGPLLHGVLRRESGGHGGRGNSEDGSETHGDGF